MSATESRAESNEQEPFVIRAHHLIFYEPVVKGISSPSSVVRDIRSYIRDSQKESFKPKKYAKDVLGSGWDQDLNFVEIFKKALSTFLVDLPDNSPAEIVEGRPDAICNGCAIGEHCRQLFNNGYHEGESSFEKDKKYIDLFLNKLRDLNLPQPITSHEQTVFPDAGPLQTRRVRTTIGAIKTVLREKNFSVPE